MRAWRGLILAVLAILGGSLRTEAVDWGGLHWSWNAPEGGRYEVLPGAKLSLRAPFGSRLAPFRRESALLFTRTVPDNDFNLRTRVRIAGEDRVSGSAYGLILWNGAADRGKAQWIAFGPENRGEGTLSVRGCWKGGADGKKVLLKLPYSRPGVSLQVLRRDRNTYVFSFAPEAGDGWVEAGRLSCPAVFDRVGFFVESDQDEATLVFSEFDWRIAVGSQGE